MINNPSAAHNIVEDSIHPLRAAKRMVTRWKWHRQRVEVRASLRTNHRVIYVEGFDRNFMANPKIEALKKVLALDPQDEVAWFGLGKAQMGDGNLQEATDALERCIAVKPAYSAAYYALAQCLHKLGQLPRCREVCERGIVVSTQNGDAMVTKNLESLKQLLS